MAHSLLALTVQRKRYVPQPASCADDGSVCFLVNNDTIELPDINDQVPIFST